MARPEEVRLSSGIPVILQPYDGGVAATYWWVRSGSSDERRGEEGFAHYLEHMLFKDAAAKETGAASTGATAREIESLGGDINAYTSFDQTVYHVTCAETHWERVLESFGLMAKPQRFLKSDFEREREVIIEELRKNEDSPGRKLFQKLFSTTFGRHPYGRPVIGYRKTLERARLASLEAYYRRQDGSGRMGRVRVGPTSESRRKSLLGVLEKRFGSKVLPRREAPGAPPPGRIPERGRPAVHEERFDVKTPTLALAFRTPGLQHPDVPALDALAGTLGSGEISRLYQKLFYGESAVTDVSGGLYAPGSQGMIYFQAECEDLARLGSAGRTLLDELSRIRGEGPTPEELERVITQTESEKLYATQTADGLASRLGFLRFVLGDLDYDHRYLEAIRALTRGDVERAARSYLTGGSAVSVALVPKDSNGIDKKELEALITSKLGLAATGKKVERKGARTVGPGGPLSDEGQLTPEFFTTTGGIRVAYLQRPDSPVFSIYGAALGGVRLELSDPLDSPEKDWGSSNLIALTWTKGTSTRSSSDLARAVEGRAASLDGFSGRNTVGIQLTGLGRDWDSLSEIFSEVLCDPTFADSEVEHSRRVAEDSIRSVEDHTGQLCSKLFLETLFERHPYGRLPAGSLESVGRIDSGKLRAFHRHWVSRQSLVLSISGPVARPKLVAWLESLEKALGSSEKTGAAKAAQAVAPEPALRAPRWVERRMGREQVHVLVGGLGITLDSQDRDALRLLHTLVGGQSGRLFIELREKKSLAYSVAPVSFEGIEPGYVGTYIASAPGKIEEALQGIQAVYSAVADRGPSEREMRRAREYFLGRMAMDLQGDASFAMHHGLETVYGIPHRSNRDVAKALEKVGSREIRAAARRYCLEPSRVTCTVG